MLQEWWLLLFMWLIYKTWILLQTYICTCYTNEKYCFHVRSWSDYGFYALREGTSNKMNEFFKKLRNVDCVLGPKLESCSVYPNISREVLLMNVFNDIVSSPHPILCNWLTIIMKHALNMDRNHDNYAHGYSQESNVDEG